MQVILGFTDRIFAIVENACSQYGIGTADLHPVRQMLQITHAAGSNDRHFYRIADGPREFEIEANFGAVSVHTCQQQLSRTQLHHALRPFHCIQTGRLAAAMGKYFPMIADPLAIDCDYDAL